VSDSRALPCIDCVLVGFVLREATARIPGRTVYRQTIRGPPPIESGDASVDLLPASLAKAPRPPNIPLIAPDQLSRVAATYVDKLLRGTRPEIFLSSGPRSSSWSSTSRPRRRSAWPSSNRCWRGQTRWAS